MFKKITSLIPGILLALGIAAIARLLENLETSAGLHIIGASVIALFIGMIINAFWKPGKATTPGIRFTSKKLRMVFLSYPGIDSPTLRFGQCH